MVRTLLRPLVIIAALLDLVAIGLLAADLVAAYGRDVISVLYLSAVGIPVALAGAITSGVAVTRTFRRVPLPVTVLVVVLSVPIGAVLLGVAANATPNPAASAEGALDRTVTAAGGDRLCGAGDPGLGPDNFQPYWNADYEVPDGAVLKPRLTVQAEALGWTVSSDPADDSTRTTPRVQIDEGGTTGDACGSYGQTNHAASGMHLVLVQVLLPYRR